MEYEEVKQIVENAFLFRMNHLENSLGTARKKGDIYFLQKAIDKLELIKNDILKDIKERLK